MAYTERNVWLVTSSLLLLLAAYGLRDQLPFFGVLLIGSFVLCIVLFKHGGRYPIVAYNAGYIVLALGLGEFFLWQPSGPEGAYFEGGYNNNYFALDKELGYGLTRWKRSVTSIKKKKDGGATIYNVSYQINELGFRDVPHNGAGSPVFFFGDSSTFGEGVDDDDTLPAQFSKATGRKACNFGVHGYGPHQFLRMLEVARLEELGIREKPALIICTFLPSHVDRTAGYAHWDKDGPLYELSSAGLAHQGSFQTQRRRFLRVISRSTIYQAARARFLENYYRRIVPEILKRSRQLISNRYGVDMLVVIWDASLSQPSGLEQARVAWLADELSKSGVASFSVSHTAPAPRGPDYYIHQAMHIPTREPMPQWQRRSPRIVVGAGATSTTRLIESVPYCGGAAVVSD